jgi:hypothetical protein
MQLDKTRIAIRPRSWTENLDLALRVIRTYTGPLLVAAVVGVLPMVLLNNYLLEGILNGREPDDAPRQFLWWICLLTLMEIPLATAPITLYLGYALFETHPQPRRIARDFASCLPQLVLLQVMLRFFLIFPVITWILPYAIWPYLSEVILLERNPLRGRGGDLSTMRRSSVLHAASSGELFGRALGSLCLALALVTVLWLSAWYLHGVFTGYWEFSPIMYTVLLPIAIWSVAGYFAVVRFLGYLDQRIRREGWEIELVLRAQRARMARQIA